MLIRGLRGYRAFADALVTGWLSGWRVAGEEVEV
jgi:hypothetical protein